LATCWLESKQLWFKSEQGSKDVLLGDLLKTKNIELRSSTKLVVGLDLGRLTCNSGSAPTPKKISEVLRGFGYH
jgi:hypothetical protein